MRILSGVYQPGQRLPSVRELAEEACVNPNTMQRALTELERRNLIYTERTAGRFITENMELIQEMKEQAAGDYTEDYFQKMRHIGISEDEILSLFHEYVVRSHDFLGNKEEL